MQINTNTIVSVTEANQNFSRVTRIAEKNGQAVIFKNNRPKYMVIDLESSPMLELTDDEKIDIVDFDEDPATFIANSLSPSRVNSVTITDEDTRSARVVVPDYQLSLAIGKEGQNARLAAKLTGWRIDIVSDAKSA